MGRFHYAFSHELQQRIQIKIGSVAGERPQPSIHEFLSSSESSFVRNLNDVKRIEPYVVCQVFADGQPLCVPVQTSFKSFADKWNWNEWLTLPLSYCDVPRHAILAFSIHELVSPFETRIIGSTTISMFANDGTFRRSIHNLKLWPNVEPDVHYHSSTPGKIEPKVEHDSFYNHTIGQLSNAGSELKTPIIKWDDDNEHSTLEEINRIIALIRIESEDHTIRPDWLEKLTLAKVRSCLDEEQSNSKWMLLQIEFARTMIDNNECTVLYFESNSEDIESHPVGYMDLVVEDPEVDLENIVESKHLKLARSGRKAMNKDLKPTREDGEKLNRIIAYPPGKFLSVDEQDLVWKYRFFLSQNNKALAKFLQCVHWSQEEEVKQALDLLQQWANMDTEDALELLGPSYDNSKIRAYAVSRLRLASNEDLLLYLLQLVQALRYEPQNTNEADFTSEPQSGFLSSHENAVAPTDSTSSDPNISPNPDIDLSTFLIQQACEKPIIANYLFWYSQVELENSRSTKDSKTYSIYKTFHERFIGKMKRNESSNQFWATLEAQQKFVEKLIELTNLIKQASGTAKAKEEELRNILTRGDSAVGFNFLNFKPIPLPLDPEVYICGIIPDKVKVFKSAKLPFLFVFETTKGDEYPVIFKNGDDLRQDQLILQMITLMDRILRKESIDLRLTPYKVLSTGLKYGFVQFIESQTLRSVIENHGTIRQYFQTKVLSNTRDENLALENGIPRTVMDAYVKSCAGYCIITYLLGIGDRHQDNLLLRDSGQLFHIDFGFIMGHDPKPQAQPMRLSKDMIEMFDQNRLYEFFRHCFTVFIILRKHTNVFANLFTLMLEANIPDIASERDETVKKLLNKFRLDFDNEKVAIYLKELIHSSISAILPQIYDKIHYVAQTFFN